MSRLSFLGFLGTALYLLIIFTLTLTNWERFSGLSPNEWGDFLAGTVGPLALIWLVLGYFQQSSELKNSVVALELQAKELNESVQQQKAMVEISLRQQALASEARKEQLAEVEDKGLPLISLFNTGTRHCADEKTVAVGFSFSNHGRDATSVHVSAEGSASGYENNFGIAPSKETFSFELILPSETLARWKTKLRFTSTNMNGVSRVQVFEVTETLSCMISCVPPRV